MKQLSLILIFAFIFSTSAATNDSIGTGENLSVDTVAVKSRQETINSGDSLKLLKANFIDSVQKVREKRDHERRKHFLVAGIITGGSAAVTFIVIICVIIAAIVSSPPEPKLG
jgi:hypothetical protein